MASSPEPATGKSEGPRFRGNWAPLLRDPAKFAYLPSATKALEKATEHHDLEEEEVADVQTTALPQPTSPRTAEDRTDPRGDALLRDAEEARARVERLRRKHPDLDLDALCELLIQAKCKQGAVVGLCAAGPAMLLPGWGSLASVLLGGVADLTLTTRLEVDLALEIAALYGLFDVYCADATARKNFLLHVAGLEGLDESRGALTEADDKATREAGERLAVRATEEVGKRSLIRFVPVIGATVGAGTNVVGIYVIGKRAQTICKGEDRVGTWRESVNKHAVPADVARAMEGQMSRVPSAVTVKIAQITTSIGVSARRLVATSSSAMYTSTSSS